MIKNYSYTASEFFYDNGFKDYNQNYYVLTYNQPLDHNLICPNKIVLQEKIGVLAYRPDNDIMPLSDWVGVFDAMQDDVGVFGSHSFIDSKLGTLLKNTIGKDGLYMLAPIGQILFDRNETPIEFILTGLYMRYKKD